MSLMESLVRKYVVALSVALMIVPPASAQEWVNVGIWGNGILGQAALRNAEAATKQRGRDSAGKPGTTSGQRASGATAALPFARSGDMTGQIEEAVATRLRELVSLRFRMEDPSRLVKTAGAREIYQRELVARRLPEDSVSGATALFLAIGWELANERKLSAAQNAAILRQTSAGLQTTPLARQSDARRQEEAEMRLIISALWQEEARVRAESPALTREMSDSVWRDLKAITDNDMRAYVVTAQGFSRR